MPGYRAESEHSPPRRHTEGEHHRHHASPETDTTPSHTLFPHTLLPHTGLPHTGLQKPTGSVPTSDAGHTPDFTATPFGRCGPLDPNSRKLQAERRGR